MLFYGTFYGNLGAIDLTGGITVWEYPGDTYAYLSSPLLVDRMLLLGSYNGQIQVLDPFSGRNMTFYQTGFFIHSSPALSEGILTFGSMDSNLYAFDISTEVNIIISSYGEEVSTGGSLAVEAGLVNSSNELKSVDAWIEAVLPSGAVYRVASYHDVPVAGK